MNTQSHLLLGAACLAYPMRGGIQWRPVWRMRWAAVLTGSLFPDLSLYVMWLWAKASGIPDARIWSELYYSDFWQTCGAATNSIPLFSVVALLAWHAGGRLQVTTEASTVAKLSPPGDVSGSVLLFALAALLHVALDFPLHVDDGHAHFWPLTDWVFSSPISYWDSDHYGHVWAPIEWGLSTLWAAVLWQRFPLAWVRGLLCLALGSFALMAAYWASTFG